MGFLNKLFGRSPKPPNELYLNLRSRVLNLRVEDVELIPDQNFSVYGVIMETGISDEVATFVCLADGTVSLYLSTGGGVIGGGEHENVREACFEMLEIVNKYADEFIQACSPTYDYPMPQNGQVFFYLLTLKGVFQRQCIESELATGHHRFSALFNNCHVVMSELRETEQRVRKEREGH